MVKRKTRFAGKATEDQLCCVDGCRIRGRFVFKSNQYCHGHLTKVVVEDLKADGTIQVRKDEEYVNTKRPFKHRFGRETQEN